MNRRESWIRQCIHVWMKKIYHLYWYDIHVHTYTYIEHSMQDEDGNMLTVALAVFLTLHCSVCERLECLVVILLAEGERNSHLLWCDTNEIDQRVRSLDNMVIYMYIYLFADTTHNLNVRPGWVRWVRQELGKSEFWEWRNFMDQFS